MSKDAGRMIVEKYDEAWFVAQANGHPSREDCNEQCGECMICGWRDCPHHEPLHYHHDGCPACDTGDECDANEG